MLKDPEPYPEIRDAVRQLCARFPDEYFRKTDEQRAYPEAFVDALTLPEVTERLKASDQIVVGSTPAQAAATLAADSAKWGAVARRIGLGLD